MRGPLAGAVLLVAAALTTAPAAAQMRPPGLVPDVGSVEAGLWGAMDRAERDVRNSAELNRDPELTAYIHGLVCEAFAEYCGELRVYVMDRPAFNALMAPNGYMEVWSGLLLRVESEAELMFVLGHEAGHYVENHSLEQWNTQKGWATTAMVITIGAGVTGAYYQVDLSVIGDIAYLAAASTVMSYSRGQETQADRIGFERTVAAGYDPTAGGRLWRNLQRETAASSFASVRRREASNSIFRSHPLTADRIEALDALAADVPEAGRLERERYRAAIRPHLAGWLAAELNRRDYGGQLELTARLERLGEDLGLLAFHRGEIYRQRREEGDRERARDAYLVASEYPDAPVAVWRELGDLQARLGDPAGARRAYETYLEQATAADDRWIVEDSLASLQEPSP